MTVLTEVERITNDRPLTKLSYDPLNLGALITNHLLLLQVDPSVTKISWPKGFIQRVTPGKDGRVRDVMVRTVTRLLKRDVRYLCLIEQTIEDQ
ncbi:hypothetical protein X801_01398, partial [Opisthorchis viverrini]